MSVLEDSPGEISYEVPETQYRVTHFSVSQLR